MTTFCYKVFMKDKKLYRNTDDKMIAGVVSGLADYSGVDVTLLRLGFVILMIPMRIFPLVILYILAVFIIPEKPKALAPEKKDEKIVAEEVSSEKNESPADHQTVQ
jgi:phage shock protein C